MSLLRVEHMTHYFGGLQAVSDYALELEPGQIKGLIGPNGAGKTTIFNLITGIHTPSEGHVYLDGQEITGLRPHRIAAQGLGRTFQNLALWRHMTVLEHVKMAHYSRIDYGLVGAFLGSRRRRVQEQEFTERSRELLRMLDIESHAEQLVVNLPYGVQRRVEMARALATDPKVLLLDEPTVGMTAEELRQMIEVIHLVHQRLGLAVFIIEHRLRFVMELCQEVQTLVFGRVVAQGEPEEILNHPKVIEAYLGEDWED